MVTRTLALAGLVALAGCDAFGLGPDDDVGVCTTEYRAYVVEVVGPGGEPVPGLAARSVVVSTGVVLGASDGERAPSTTGVYVVATDGDRRALGAGPTAVRFTAEGDELRADADYVFAFDACHVTRLSGPDQVEGVRR